MNEEARAVFLSMAFLLDLIAPFVPIEENPFSHKGGDVEEEFSIIHGEKVEFRWEDFVAEWDGNSLSNFSCNRSLEEREYYSIIIAFLKWVDKLLD